MSLDALKTASADYAQALIDQQAADAAYKKAFSEFEAANAALIERRKLASQCAKDAEARARDTALQHFLSTGERAPLEGIGLQERSVVEYDEPAMLEACLRWMPTLLKLDEKRVESFVMKNYVEELDKDTGEKRRVLPDYFRLPVSIALKATPTLSESKLIASLPVEPVKPVEKPTEEGSSDKPADPLKALKEALAGEATSLVPSH